MSSFQNMVNTPFEGVGTSAGTCVWRIAKKKLLLAAGEELSGVFYDKECYLVLHTKEKQNGGFTWNLFTWKGSAASMISSGFVGSNAAKLNNLLTANANQRDVVLQHVKDGDGPTPKPLLEGAPPRPPPDLHPDPN